MLAGFCYVDDNGIIGVRQAAVQRAHERFGAAAGLKDLEIHDVKSHGAQKESIKLGFRIDGRAFVVEPKPEKWLWMRRVLRGVARQRRVTGKMLEALLGHAASIFVLHRP